MRRWPLRVLLCLILLTGGAITTVAVAWCGVFEATTMSESPVFSDSSPVADQDLQVWTRHAGDGWPSAPHYGQYSGGHFVTRRVLQHHETTSAEFLQVLISLKEPHDLGHFRVEHLASGFPARCLWSESWKGVPQASTVFAPTIGHNGLSIGERVLPLRPIWPGFLIDTLFYAAIWFGVFFGFTTAKRFIRIKRGRCPRCEYDLQGNLNAGCPECGLGREP